MPARKHHNRRQSLKNIIMSMMVILMMGLCIVLFLQGLDRYAAIQLNKPFGGAASRPAVRSAMFQHTSSLYHRKIQQRLLEIEEPCRRCKAEDEALGAGLVTKRQNLGLN